MMCEWVAGGSPSTPGPSSDPLLQGTGPSTLQHRCPEEVARDWSMPRVSPAQQWPRGVRLEVEGLVSSPPGFCGS